MTIQLLLQLLVTKGVGDAVIRRVSKFLLREGVTLADVASLGAAELANALSVPVEVASRVKGQEEAAARLGQSLCSHDVELVWLNDERYPKRMTAVLGEDAPPVLFARGNLRLLEGPAVGFCGSRRASEKGLCVTRKAAQGLAQQGVCVVSGYASGVDLAAHSAALEAGGGTIFVLVDGILRFQAKASVRDYLTPENHLIVSQFPPSLTWISRNAMKRNATIIGMSDAMILVESGTSGGTYSAGTETLKRQHPLFVVDFAQPGPSAEANPFFIQRGGVPVRGNAEGAPNLSRVLAATRSPAWSQRQRDGQLFE